MLIGFIIWAAAGCLFIGLGIHAFLSKKEVPLGFWANADTFPVKDVKAYNRAFPSTEFPMDSLIHSGYDGRGYCGYGGLCDGD